MRKSTIYIISLCLFTLTTYAQQPSLCDFLGDLKKQVVAYSCPNKNIVLSKQLYNLSQDKKLIEEICETNDECLNWPWSLTHEAFGLSYITSAPQPDFCSIAMEDRAQLIFYFANYQNNHCLSK